MLDPICTQPKNRGGGAWPDWLGCKQLFVQTIRNNKYPTFLIFTITRQAAQSNSSQSEGTSVMYFYTSTHVPSSQPGFYPSSVSPFLFFRCNLEGKEASHTHNVATAAFVTVSRGTNGSTDSSQRKQAHRTGVKGDTGSGGASSVNIPQRMRKRNRKFQLNQVSTKNQSQTGACALVLAVNGRLQLIRAECEWTFKPSKSESASVQS